MAIAFPTVSATSFSIQGRETLSSLRNASLASSVRGAEPAIPSGILSQSGAPVVLTQQEGRALLSTSLAAGRSILAGLEAIQDSLGLAANSSLTQTNAAILNRNGTRVSSLNIESQAGRVRNLIDQLAAAATVGGANLLLSNGRGVDIQTGAFGGSIRIGGQALDADGLGLGSLAAINQNDARLSVSEVTRAISRARERLGNLEFLQGALDFSNPSTQTFGRLLTAGSTDALPRGSFVNLSA